MQRSQAWNVFHWGAGRRGLKWKEEWGEGSPPLLKSEKDLMQ